MRLFKSTREFSPEITEAADLPSVGPAAIAVGDLVIGFDDRFAFAASTSHHFLRKQLVLHPNWLQRLRDDDRSHYCWDVHPVQLNSDRHRTQQPRQLLLISHSLSSSFEAFLLFHFCNLFSLLLPLLLLLFSLLLLLTFLGQAAGRPDGRGIVHL